MKYPSKTISPSPRFNEVAEGLGGHEHFCTTSFRGATLLPPVRSKIRLALLMDLGTTQFDFVPLAPQTNAIILPLDRGFFMWKFDDKN